MRVLLRPNLSPDAAIEYSKTAIVVGVFGSVAARGRFRYAILQKPRGNGLVVTRTLVKYRNRHFIFILDKDLEKNFPLPPECLVFINYPISDAAQRIIDEVTEC